MDREEANEKQPRLIQALSTAHKRLSKELEIQRTYNETLQQVVEHQNQQLQDIMKALRQVTIPFRQDDVVGQVIQLVTVHKRLCQHVDDRREEVNEDPDTME